MRHKMCNRLQTEKAKSGDWRTAEDAARNSHKGLI